MAAFMRGVFSLERNVFLSKGSCVVVESKRYVRGLRRTPVRILFPEKETGKIVKPSPPPPPQPEPVKPNVKRLKEAKVSSASTKHSDESSFFKRRSFEESITKPAQTGKDYLDGLRFERASPGDKRLARLVSVARSRTFREHQGKILLEGRRLICDALEAGAKPQTVFFSTVDRLRELPLDKLRRATLVKVKFEDIKIWSDLVAPQGVIAIFSRPDPSKLNFTNSSHGVPLSLICDNIRDPGNLGTMLRCAAAAGCQNVLLTTGCVDIWEPKVLRAAMGAHFRLPIYPSLDWDDIEGNLSKSVTVHVADSSVTDTCGDTDDEMTSKAGDYGWISTSLHDKNMRYEEYDSDSDLENDEFSNPRLDTKLYHDSWAQRPTALVIGGETHGLSVEAVKLAAKTDGHRLFIPIVPNVDSLNSAMATSVLLFEGRKQLLKLLQTSRKKAKSKVEKLS